MTMQRARTAVGDLGLELPFQESFESEDRLEVLALNELGETPFAESFEESEDEGSVALALGSILRSGSSGAEVFALQRALMRLGLSVTPDGKFGPGTARAVREFQSRSGISADGVAGPRTKAAILAALGGSLPVKPLAPARPSGITPSGRLVVDTHPLMRSHRGTSPDLVLRWNQITQSGAVDVVLHFHGYAGQREGMRIDRHKEAFSGLDFVDPANHSTPGRTDPTIAVLPRGNYFGGNSGIGYNFPALVKPGVVRVLVSDALERVSRETGHALTLNRLILTGHSGGGAPVSAVVADADPDEVHIFDGTYGSGASIARWAERRIAREVASPASTPPALRVLFRPETQTASQAKAIARDLCRALRNPAAAALRRRFRVDSTATGHNEIPGRFGWQLLADAGADLPGATTEICAGERETEASPMWETAATEREQAAREAIDMSAQNFSGENYDVNEEMAWLDFESEGAFGEWAMEDENEEGESLEAKDEDEQSSDRERFGELNSEADLDWDPEVEDEGYIFEQEHENALEAAGLTTAERKAVEITSTLETGKPGGFYGLSSNFDGQGLSFGLVNWTIGTGSLQPLLRDFASEQPARWNAVFGPDAELFLGVITPKGAGAEKDQHRFAVEHMNSLTMHGTKRIWRIREPWVKYFKRLSEDAEFKKIQIRYVRTLLSRAEYFCRYFSLKSEAAYAFMFDAVSSHGKAWLTRKIKSSQLRRTLLRPRLDALKAQYGANVPEKEILLSIADVLGATSAPRWAAKVRVRKRWFVTGEHSRAHELRGLEPRLDVPYSTSPASANFDEAFEPGDAFEPSEAEFGEEVSMLEGMLEAEAGAGSGLAERIKGITAFVLGPTLRRGSAGPGVSVLQRCLTRLGFAVTEDGKFGPGTEKAVRAFQSRSGITPDAVCGPRTKAAIAAAVGAGPGPSPQPLPLPTRPSSNSALVDAIVRTAEQEFQRWHGSNGKLRETDNAAVPILQQYYREGVQRQVSATELQDTSWQKAHPWSAVFISFVMRTAGAGTMFKYSAAHQVYVAAARRNRLDGVTSTPFWAYRATEVAPQVGDLICASRSDSGANYDNIADSKSRATHCDVVTEVRPGSLRVIGGNVNQNVDAKTIRTLPDGRLALDGAQARFYAVVRCRGPIVAPGPQPEPQPPTPPSGPPVPQGQQLTPAQFVAVFGASARTSQAKNSVPALVTLGQAALESGWGKHAPRFNFFGIKAKASDPANSRQLLRTREVLSHPNGKFPEVISVTPRADGKFDYVVRDWFRAFPDAATAFNAHGEFLVRNKRYEQAFQAGQDAYAFAAAVARAGYATDPSYERVLKGVMQKIESAGGGILAAA